MTMPFSEASGATREYSADEVREDLRAMEASFRLLRELADGAKNSYFDRKLGFPDAQDPLDKDRHDALKTKEVLQGLLDWAGGAEEDADPLYPGDKERLVQALTAKYPVLRAYYEIKDDAPWADTRRRFSDRQSYRLNGYPDNEVERVRKNLNSN